MAEHPALIEIAKAARRAKFETLGRAHFDETAAPTEDEIEAVRATLRAMKTLSIAALNVGWAVMPEDIVERVELADAMSVMIDKILGETSVTVL